MVVESAEGVELLLDVGLDRRVVGSRDVEIAAGDGHWSRRRVLLLRHSPSPTELQRALITTATGDDGLYFVVGRAGTTLVDAARRDPRIAYGAVDDGVVSFLGELYRAEMERAHTRSTPGRTSWVRLAVLRLFALAPAVPLSQSAIARRIGASHVAVGKQITRLDELVDRTGAGWRATDRAGCWDRFMAEYPGPRGLRSYWAATDEVAGQLARIEHVLPDQSNASLTISGDFAADFYAPWRRPTRIVGYVTWQPPLEHHGFASVRGSEATVELRIAQDPTILHMACAWPTTAGGAERRLVDPLIAAWDLSRTPGSDVEAAVQRLRDQALREPLWQ